jgi:hypothetical protein
VRTSLLDDPPGPGPLGSWVGLSSADRLLVCIISLLLHATYAGSAITIYEESGAVQLVYIPEH